MQDFNLLFPHFSERCLELKTILTPMAYVLITSGLIATTISSHRSGSALLRIFGRAIVLVMLIVYLPGWGNAITSMVDSTVREVLRVDPAQIHDQYQAALELKKAAAGERSWWEKLMDWRAAPLEWMLTGFFLFLGWVASALVWWAYILQTAILFVGYGLSPLFIGTLAFPALNDMGRRFLSHLVGVMAWPLGWGVAGLVTEGMIDFMTDRSFLSTPAATDLYSLQNFMGVAFLGVWIIFSTVAAPVMIQNAVEHGRAAMENLFSGLFTSGRSAMNAGVASLAGASSGMTGTSGALAAGIISAATAAETLGASAVYGGHGGGSLIGTLGEMRSTSARSTRTAPHPEPIRFPQHDPIGDRTVKNTLKKTQNPYSAS